MLTDPPVKHLPANTVAIDRVYDRISVHVTCASLDEAKQLHRELCAGAREGALSLWLDLVPRPVIEAAE